jgi:hypothetical protein
MIYIMTDVEIEITEEMVAAGLDAFTDIAHSEPGTEEICAGLIAAFTAMLKASGVYGAAKPAWRIHGGE